MKPITRLFSACGVLQLLVLSITAAPEKPAGSAQHQLAPFVDIRTCVPFNVLLRLSSNASLLIDAEPAVQAALRVNVSNGMLAVSTANDFSTSRTIKVVVNVPRSPGLQSVQNSGIGDVLVGPGFNSTNLTVSASGTGGVYWFNITANDLSVSTTGFSTVLMNGQIHSTQVYSSGSSKVFLTGNVSGNVVVRLDGFSTAFVQGAPGTSISGTADGLAKVLYTEGRCTVKSSLQALFGVNVLGEPCSQVDAGVIPSVTPAWSCGLMARGRTSCAGAELNTGASSSTSQASSSGPSTSTVSGPGGTATATTFTSGPGALASSQVQGPGLGLTQVSKGGSTPTVIQTSRTGGATQEAATWPPDLDAGGSGSLSVVSLTCADPYPVAVPVNGTGTNGIGTG